MKHSLADRAILERAFNGPIPKDADAADYMPSVAVPVVITTQQHRTILESCRPLLARSLRRVTDLAAQIAAEQAERDQMSGVMRDIKTRHIGRLVERYDAEMGNVQRYSRAVSLSEGALVPERIAAE